MHVLYLVYSFFFGTLFGSFVNVLIYRIPKKMDVVLKRSHCAKCKKAISWYHNIPVFSYLFLRGKCFFCKTPIGLRHLLVELGVGLLALYIYQSMGVSLLSFIYFFIGCIFVAHFFIDIDFQILPDVLNLVLLILVLIVVFIKGSWQLSFIGGAMGFGGTLLITWLFYLLKGKVGLGGGDIKLFGILGLLFGPLGIAQNIFLSCLLGSIVMIILILSGIMKRDQPIAFGPFIIAIAFWQLLNPLSFEKIFNNLNYYLTHLL